MGLSKQEIEKQKAERLGEENYNYFGSLMRIIEYNGARDITVEFQDEYKTVIKNREYKEFKKGVIKNPYDKEVCGVACIGVGRYKSRGEDGKKTLAYRYWRDMLDRCYNPYHLNERPTYIDCYVCDEWLNFQNFAEWFYKNYYEIEGQKMQLDKDILVKGNKIYSPETCVFVPQRINQLFIGQCRKRGGYPIGVVYYKPSNKLSAQCSIIGENKERKNVHLGYFPLNKPFQAFYAYKKFKEDYIKQIAKEYKNLIPRELYDTMMKYEVEIND